MGTDTFVNKKIAIIGSGHMARAMVEGLVQSGKVSPSCMMVSNPSGTGLAALQHEFRIQTTRNNEDAADFADWIFVAVKPLVIKNVMEEIARAVQGKLVISLAAGVSVALLQRYVGPTKQHVIRIMPNIPIACNDGVIGFYADVDVPRLEVTRLCSFLCGLGKVIEVQDEKDLDTITLVVGCGPAIVSHAIAMFARFGTASGLSETVSQDISLQTFQGTLAYLATSGLTPEALRQSVATRGGVTEEIIRSMERKGFEKVFHQSLHAGYAKIKTLHKKLYGNA